MNFSELIDNDVYESAKRIQTEEAEKELAQFGIWQPRESIEVSLGIDVCELPEWLL